MPGLNCTERRGRGETGRREGVEDEEGGRQGRGRRGLGEREPGGGEEGGWRGRRMERGGIST